MNRTRTLLAICAISLPIPAFLAGCGGDDEGEGGGPRDVVERAFSNEREVASGVIDVELEVDASGEQGGSFSFALQGPFVTDPDDPRALPELDLEMTASGSGGGEQLDEAARLIITGENLFVEYDGVTYEGGDEMFGEFSDAFGIEPEDLDEDASPRELCEQTMNELGGDAEACDIDVLEDWITDLEDQGTEDVEGVSTNHVSGALDVERVLGDFGRLLSSTPDLGFGDIDPSQFADAVPEASFDVFSGAEDDHIRRLDAELEIDPSALLGGLIEAPVEAITVSASTTVSELDEPQTIEAPTGPTKPLDRLLDRIGLFKSVGGVDVAPGLGGGELPDLGDDSGPGSDDGGPDDDGGPGAQSEVSPEQAQEYLQCLQDAGGDPKAINSCADELE